TKFNKSLFHILIELALPNVSNDFVWSTQQDQQNGTIHDIIGLKFENDIDQRQLRILEEITASGIVPVDFRYYENPFATANNETFLAFVSNIDKNDRTIYMQPEDHMEYMQKLIEELDIYYSHPISEKLTVDNISTGLACVTKYEGIYHRVVIKENHISTCIIICVDLGITEKVQVDEVHFKHLLNHFASLPCLAIPCRLLDIEFKHIDYQMSPETYKELSNLCQSGPFFVESYGQVNGMLNVKIFDLDRLCLNDIVVQKGLAFSSSLQSQMTIPPTIVTKNYKLQRNTQQFSPTMNFEENSSDYIDEIDTKQKTVKSNENCLMNDYEPDIISETVIEDNSAMSKTKGSTSAQTSLDKWEDNSRINRRIKDLQVIFEFNSNYKSSNHPFHVTPTGLQQIIDRQKIKSYFDLGCGDGTITAGIGVYLGLTKENIFGGDVYEGQNNAITFVKVNENQSTIDLPSNHVDLITSFVTFHHISQLEKTLSELVRILRPGGYLIMREHDCKKEYSLSAKYLNFVHAIMMIARVGEFAVSTNNYNSKNQHGLNDDYENNKDNWTQKKSNIIEYTKSIHYRTCDEWQQQLRKIGFHLCATLYYGVDGSGNPQKLFYAVYQLDKK
ncbi:unnamed protein product, partial [Rotaria sp. Silwood2]